MTGLKLKSVTIFPSRVSGGLAMNVEKANGNYTIAIDYANLAVVSPYIPKATDFILAWDSFVNSYFLVPTTSTGSNPASDPYFAQVVLLMGFESGTMLDESPAAHGTATITGAASVSGSISKFGSKSLLLNGGVIQFPDSNDWWFGGNPFTIEMWINYVDANPGDWGFLVGQWQSTGQFGWEFWAQNPYISWNTSTTGSDNNADLSATLTPSAGVWYHVAFDYDGTTIRIYLNGVQSGQTVLSRTLFNSTNHLTIGGDETGSALNFKGYIDEIRITKGVARYATSTSFSVPTAPFPRS